MHMHHVRIDLFTAAQMLGLLPPSGELFGLLPFAVASLKSLKSSVIRVVTEVAGGKTPTAIYNVMRSRILEIWPNAQIEPIRGEHPASIVGLHLRTMDARCSSPTIGDHVVRWGASFDGQEPNLERGMVVAEVTLDRPNRRIASIKALPQAERYALAFAGRSGAPDISKEEIAKLQDATRQARALVAAPATEEAALEFTLQEECTAAQTKLSPAQRRSLISRLLDASEKGVHDGGNVYLHPLEWSDAETARTMNLPVGAVTMERINLGIQVMSRDQAVNQAVEDVRRAIDRNSDADDVETLTSTSERLRQDARRLLQILGL